MWLSTPGRARTAAALLALAAALGAGTAAAQRPAAVELAVVVHPDLPVDDVSFAELRKILLGDRQFWSSGMRVTLLVQPPKSPEREIILKKIYRMTDTQFRQYWIAKVFRAEASSEPKIFYSNEMAFSLVAQIPGAVALVKADDAPDGVKVLKIDGRGPGDADYRLR